jgi:tetratricopeptide (TPR) repeat protein
VVYAAIFLAVWAAGLLTMAPACPHGDSGETAAVALHLGIAHPPGYPLPTMLGKLATTAFQAGTIAWRVSLLALLSSALSAVLAASLLRAVMPGVSGILLFVLGTLVGLGLEPWNQATTPKGSVYTVTVALLAGLAWCSRGNPGTAGRRLVLFGLLTGLVCGGHYMVVFPFLPFMLVPLALEWWPRRREALRYMLLAAVAAVFGATLYLYMPVRSPQVHPALRWADPVKWPRFSWLVFRRQYMSIEKQPRGNIGWIQSARQLKRFASGYTWAWPVLAAAGLGVAVRRREWWLVALGAGALAEGVAAAFYPKLEADSLWVADGYFSTAWWAFALLGAAGLAWLAGRFRKAALAASLLLLAWAAWRGGDLVSKRWNYYGHDSQANLLSLTPPDTLLFAEGDAFIAPLLYGLYVDGDRPDVRVIIPIFLHFDWGLRELAEQYPDLVIPALRPWGHIWQETKDLMEANARRPFMYTMTVSNGWPFSPVSIPAGLTYKMYTGAREVIDPAIERAMMRYRLRDVMNRRLDNEAFARVVRENYIQAYFNRGIWRHSRKEDGYALEMFNRATRLGSPEAALNAGLILWGRGDVAGAEKNWSKAAEYAPGRPEPWVNLALVAMQKGGFDGALGLCEKAIRLNPGFAKAYEVGANAWYRKGNIPRAYEYIQRAVYLNPSDPALRALAKGLEKKAGTAR